MWLGCFEGKAGEYSNTFHKNLIAMKIAIIAPMLLHKSEEIENMPAPHSVGIYPPMMEPKNAAI